MPAWLDRGTWVLLLFEYVSKSSSDFSKVMVSLAKFKKRGDIKGKTSQKEQRMTLQEKNRGSFQCQIKVSKTYIKVICNLWGGNEGRRRGGGVFIYISSVMEISKKGDWNVEWLEQWEYLWTFTVTSHEGCGLRNLSETSLHTKFPPKDHGQFRFLTAYILIYVCYIFVFYFASSLVFWWY